jgi:hypothetical protein
VPSVEKRFRRLRTPAARIRLRVKNVNCTESGVFHGQKRPHSNDYREPLVGLNRPWHEVPPGSPARPHNCESHGCPVRSSLVAGHDQISPIIVNARLSDNHEAVLSTNAR